MGALPRLEGRWIWGGLMYRAFSHFIAESPARLWGIDTPEAQGADGLVFIARHARNGPDLSAFQRGVFDAFGVDLPIKVLCEATRIDRLVVPGQGFGLGEIVSGTARFRDFAARRFGAGIAPEGPDKLYVSRSALGLKGGLLGEDLLEAELRGEGFEIFHPQKHDIATQIARYKAARQIVACDGSALHLLAFVARPDQRVAVIGRRRSGSVAQIAAHLRSFSGTAPLVIDALRAVWHHRPSARARLAVGEPDMARLRGALAAGGFVSGPGLWDEVPPEAGQSLGPDYTRREVAPSSGG